MKGEPDATPTPEGENDADALREVPFGYLLLTLIVMILAYPFHDETPLAYLVFAAINSAVLVAAAFAVSRSRWTLLFALLLATPAVILQWIHAVALNSLIGAFGFVAMTAFYGFTIFHVLSDVLRPGPVSRNKVCGAIAAYMLTAVVWACLYGLTDRLVPGSFIMLGQSDAAHPLTIRDLLYFSFTTLTTTGYGDITPSGPHAQSLAILEQQTGVFYVAILIARLAGLYRPGISRSIVDDLRRLRRRDQDRAR